MIQNRIKAENTGKENVNVLNCPNLKHFSFKNLEFVKNASEESTFSFEDEDKKLISLLKNYDSRVLHKSSHSNSFILALRSKLIHWLKKPEASESENLSNGLEKNLLYEKFMTQKKMIYLLRNKKHSEKKISKLESDLILIKESKTNLEELIGDIYVHYSFHELEEEITRLSNCYEFRSGKSKKMRENVEHMKSILPHVKVYHNYKESISNISDEIKEILKIIEWSSQTWQFLCNYKESLNLKLDKLKK
jgi:hypothetical protein